MTLYEHLVRRALVHERSDKLTGGKVEHEAERYRDWKRGQRLAEYCQQQQGETETLKTHTYITLGVHTHTHILANINGSAALCKYDVLLLFEHWNSVPALLAGTAVFCCCCLRYGMVY